MPFNIDTFKSNLEDYGYLQNNKYEARIFAPNFLSGANGALTSNERVANSLRFRIDSVRAPGIQLLSADNNRYGVGPTQKQVMSAQFNEMSISILADGYGEIWQFWYDWIRGIYEFTSDSATNRQGIYASRYKNDYSSIMEIIVYNNVGEIVKTFNIIDVFPTSLNEVSLSWNDTNQPLRLGISLSYKEFFIV
jgi:hypothetical protein